MSTFAFGTYRITDQNPIHLEALKEAIEAGIELIDTSTNYTDGGAERAIAKVMRLFDDEVRQKIKIVSKYGYIQGSNMQKHKEEPYENVVEYSPACYHSIAKSFMKAQLGESLERLDLSCLDCYLIHNPEYYIYESLKNNMNHDQILDNMFERIYDAFVGLEEEVKAGRIKSYGISSNSFSKSRNEADFLPYEDLLIYAANAAEEVGNEQHGFTTIELPINILETEGLKCAKWAKNNNLRVLANRPLNAQKHNLMYRLADYEENREYYHYLNELLDVSDNEELKPLYNLIEQLDINRHKFGWIGEYDSFASTQILPHIKKALEKFETNQLEDLLRYIELFLNAYREMVAYECSQRVGVELKDELKNCEKNLQICALEFLLKQEDIDYILIGMRKPTYVQEVMALKR
ncbi:aldo/keto reductase [Sulfurimonas sp.]|uniref:aldo/keto reductase n=1 Tax=Sulfurimonas sp. TaxID=2022749 RepID=UPI0026284E55|nr:aldo/keto reductase [Sulfurimonas sp.]